MIVSKVHKQPKPNIVFAPKSAPTTMTIMPDTLPSQQNAKIRERAYELYESRGCKPGQEEQDWLRAEHEILRRER